MIAWAQHVGVSRFAPRVQGRTVEIVHRGTRAKSFVRGEGNRLTIPDFAGNLHFNTSGNLLLNPRAGLLFVGFKTGDLLHLYGPTELILNGPEIDAFQGADRFWMFHVERVVRRPAALSLRWRFDGVSLNSVMTGTWDRICTISQGR